MINAKIAFVWASIIFRDLRKFGLTRSETSILIIVMNKKPMFNRRKFLRGSSAITAATLLAGTGALVPGAKAGSGNASGTGDTTTTETIENNSSVPETYVVTTLWYDADGGYLDSTSDTLVLEAGTQGTATHSYSGASSWRMSW